MIKLEELEFLEDTLSHFEFSDIITLIENGDYAAAKSLSEEKLQAGYLDIRILCYYLVSEYLCNNNLDLVDMLQYLQQTLFKHQEKLTPKKRQNEVLQKSFNWFYTRLYDDFVYLDSINKPLKLEQLAYEKIIECTNSIIENLSLEKIDILTKLQSYLKGKIVKPEMELTEDLASDGAIEAEQEVNDFQATSRNIPSLLNGPKMHKWFELLDKLELLKKLFDENKFIQAAILLKLIDEEIQNFNPLEYFPEIFANFYELRIDIQFEKLIHAIESNKQLLTWDTLYKLAKADYKLLNSSRIDTKLQSKSAVTNTNFQNLFKDEGGNFSQGSHDTAAIPGNNHPMGEIPAYGDSYQNLENGYANNQLGN